MFFYDQSYIEDLPSVASPACISSFSFELTRSMILLGC